ncbi:MAG: radical SAM protein [Candidatus Omnitrophota bacterium]
MKKPSYIKLYASGELDERIKALKKNLTECVLCPRCCKVNRVSGTSGFCKASPKVTIASYKKHMWEEPPISGTRGSGVIFFTHCTARCVFCQNFYFSQLNTGFELTEKELARIMLRIKKWGCHNINLVSPTQYLPHIISALKIAIQEGLDIPLLFNSGGYESVETLQLLDGIIDIYLPDMKYSNDTIAHKLSAFKDYVSSNRSAVSEMFRQVGILELDEDKTAQKGLIIRHLVLPGGMAGTKETLEFIAKNISKEAHISLMDQYFPEYNAWKYKEMNRAISKEEYKSAIDYFHECGLENGWIQEHMKKQERTD